jgi:uncharacterized membrane protein (DUF4010 family)
MLIAFAISPQWLPPEATKIVFTLFLSFLIGLEREEHKASMDRYVFGGIRTYPLIGLLGYSMDLLSGAQLLPLTIGFAVVAAFMWLSYQHKLQTAETAGVTTELSGLVTYVVGALVSQEHFWIAGTLGVLSVLLLELKTFLEGLSQRVPAREIFTFTKFLFLTVVILPVVPDRNIGPYGINPFKTWLVVTAVSAISYGSYLLQTLTKGRGGILLAALLGGAYSSTLTTIVLAKRAKEAGSSPRLFSGAAVLASGVMYLRLAALIAIFNRQLMDRIALPLVGLAVIGVAAGWLWSLNPGGKAEDLKQESVLNNPLELWVALLFGSIFVVMLVLTGWSLNHLGQRGLLALAAIMGVTDVDPFVLSLTQSAGTAASTALAASAVLVATASNNVVKAFYAFGFADRKAGLQSLLLLLGFALLGIVPIVWILGR